MRVQNYSVAMNAQYFSLQQDYTQAKLSTNTQDFTSDKASNISKVEISTQDMQDTNDKLSMELSKAIFTNIQSEENRPLRDIAEFSYNYSEVQALNFQVEAFIQTKDKEIELSLDVSLSRSFVMQANVSVKSLQELKDPLVISLDGTMPTLSSKTFSFDIDSDGQSQQVSKLKQGSGFLALDKNENGFIDDGSELFGTTSGDGFKDLKEYDEDKNGWIDENDAIFDKLRVWQKTEGKDRLIALGEVGIGAIFLGNTQTPFSLKSDSNELLGEIRKSSFVLFENGKAGVISQIDLAVTPEIKGSIESFDEMQKNLSVLKLDDLYSKDSDENSFDNDERMTRLQEKIKTLEVKLTKANNEEKPAIQAQIGALFAQMMALLESELQ